MQHLKFSIITPTRNAEKVLERTIASVLGQGYPLIEYIVVDGASTDSTVEILRRYGEKIQWISEPDSGPPEAINKGLRMAKGEIIGIMPASDWYEPGIFRKVAEIFAEVPEVDLVYGDFFIEEDGKKTLFRSKKLTYREIVRSSAWVCHQASFARRRLVEEVGLWDETLTIAADYEWLIRLFARAHAKYIPLPICTYHLDRNSWSLKNFRLASRQRWEAARRHGAKFYHPVFWQSFLAERPFLFRLVKRLPGYQWLRGAYYNLWGK